ncbi:hypothetical protein [Plasticicumulans sp.]|uniref:hypothetical protein n=1 Tax=Plasticicumulans sp. TaxID=2307179 RepID=UPI00396473A3
MPDDVLNTTLSRFETLSPEQYVQLSECERSAIKRVRVSPPQLGRPGFGRLVIEYDVPRYIVGRTRHRQRA